VEIQVDDETGRALEFAARMAGIPVGDLVGRLVRQASTPQEAPRPTEMDSDERIAHIKAVYDGHLVPAIYDKLTQRVEITDGPLHGQSFKSPTGAARAVISHFKPGVSPHRNGWSFWSVVGSGDLLQTLRHASTRG
jgi:hypothetical protein